MRLMNCFLLIAAVVGLTSVASAQGVSFEAGAPAVVATGEPFRIEFTVNAKPENFTAPSFDKFEVLAGPTSSQAQSVSIVNGKVSQSVTFTYTYVLQATAVGTYSVGPASVKVDGKSHSTSALAIEAVAGDAAAAGTNAPSQSGGNNPSARANATTVAADDILVRVSVNRNNVYKGQPVTATFKLYTRLPMSGIEKTVFPAFNGFWAQELNVDGQKWQRETLNGKVYDARVLKETLLYPQQSGKLYVEQFSMTVIAQIILQNRSTGSLFDNIFGGGQQVEEVRKNLTAPPVQITVKELPAGAPTSFSGAVGKYQLSGLVENVSLSANSSASFVLKISGNGNLPLLQAPKVELPASFEQYNMKTSENLNYTSSGITGFRQFEYPFIPRAEGSYVIDPIQFSYFDPESEKYITLSSEAQSIEVHPDSTGGASVSRGLVSGISKEDVKILDQDIRFIRTDNPRLHPRGEVFFLSLWYFGTLLVLAFIFGVLYAYLKKYLRERKNTTLVRHKQANKVALQRLKAAAVYMNKNEEKGFYEELLRALWGYMSDKLNIPVANLTKDNMREELLKRGTMDAEQVEQFIQVISVCEYAQYSPSTLGQMHEVYHASIKMLSKFESQIKK